MSEKVFNIIYKNEKIIVNLVEKFDLDQTPFSRFRWALSSNLGTKINIKAKRIP